MTGVLRVLLGGTHPIRRMRLMSSRTAPAARGGTPASMRVGEVRLSRQARAAKALFVAVFSTLIALVSHVLAGGSVPGLPGILVPLAFSVFVCLPLSGRILSLPRLVLSVLASQMLFHWLFVLGATGPGMLVIDDAPPAMPAIRRRRSRCFAPGPRWVPTWATPTAGCGSGTVSPRS